MVRDLKIFSEISSHSLRNLFLSRCESNKEPRRLGVLLDSFSQTSTEEFHEQTFRSRDGDGCGYRYPRIADGAETGPAAQLQGGKVLRHRQSRQKRLRFNWKQFLRRIIQSQRGFQGMDLRP